MKKFMGASCTYGQNFGMRGGVAVAERAIAGGGDDLSIARESCADGNLALRGREARGVKSGGERVIRHGL